MSIYKLALIIKNPSSNDEFLVVKQARPPKFNDKEYDSFVDSDLWDLPSIELRPLKAESDPEIEVIGAESCSDKINLRNFDVSSALNQVSEQLGILTTGKGRWELEKYVEEPEFGPGFINTVFISGQFGSSDGLEEGMCQWMTKKHALGWLLEVKQGSDRMGPLVVTGLLNDSAQSMKCDVPKTLRYQEYPPGVMLVPMQSRTGKPFHTTNLVVIAPENVPNDCSSETFAASGDAMVVDPGCHSGHHEELAGIIASLPRKLIVFVTHHHRDHVDGLSIIQRCNPDATLLAHENTMRRVGKGDWSQGYTSISGGEEIYVGGERLRIIFAPGHTDGHMGLLHVSTHSLIVGDHCVGQGSAILDSSSGGNMAEYFQTTYKFMELSPHALIPMHGRVNLWPKHMVFGYLKNRRNRESAILEAIENGAHTLFDVVATVYAVVDRSFWSFAAENVKLHVEHLALQGKLPEDFSLQRFQKTCSLHFLIKWIWAYGRSYVASIVTKITRPKLLTAIGVACFAVLYCVKTLPTLK
ncbi:hypothetical protein Ancab_018522 [Ancistrocladus abbreviatus]